MNARCQQSGTPVEIEQAADFRRQSAAVPAPDDSGAPRAAPKSWPGTAATVNGVWYHLQHSQRDRLAGIAENRISAFTANGRPPPLAIRTHLRSIPMGATETIPWPLRVSTAST